MDLAFECALFVVGLAFGSFLNVCISRIPRDESIVSPGSHCPACGAFLRWRDNIPLLSWLLLAPPLPRLRKANITALSHGRVADGHSVHSLLRVIRPDADDREVLRLLFPAGWADFHGCRNWSAAAGIHLYRESCWVWGCPGLLRQTATGTEFFLRAYGVQLPTHAQLALLDSAIGALVGAGFFYLAWALYYLFRRRHGLGFGDIALMAAVGAFLGLKLTLFVIFAAPLAGAVYAAFLLRRRPPQADYERAGSSVREVFLTQELPFGVFLGACALATVFLGESIWRWYLSFF